MTRATLKEATRRFKFFPSVAELVELFAEYRQRGRMMPESSDMHSSKVNSLAHLAVANWPAPPGLGYRGVVAWEAWAFDIACQDVRAGSITGKFHRSPSGQLQWTLDAIPLAPVAPAVLIEKWRNGAAQ